MPCPSQSGRVLPSQGRAERYSVSCLNSFTTACLTLVDSCVPVLDLIGALCVPESALQEAQLNTAAAAFESFIAARLTRSPCPALYVPVLTL